MPAATGRSWSSRATTRYIDRATTRRGGAMKGMHAAALLVSILAWGPGPALAQIYRWVDEKGVTHYEEKPAAKSAKPVDLVDPTGAPKPAEPAPATTHTIVHPDGSTTTIIRQ